MMRLGPAIDAIETSDTFRYIGHVTRVIGTMVEGKLPNARIGASCRIEPVGAPAVWAEVVGLREQSAMLMPLGALRGINAGARIIMEADQTWIDVGMSCRGRVLDALARPIDGKGPLEHTGRYPLMRSAPDPLRRRAIDTPLDLGVRTVNSLLTIGEGQRIAIAAGAGVGKSTLLSMMARHTNADVAVIALIGERGREVQEFVERDLHAGSGAEHVVVIASTSDEPPAMRLRAAFTATAVAEYFRDRGLRVLLMMDSLSRVVQAQREIGLSVGEVPATRGYPPSAFAVIPRLLERAGMGVVGSITAIYTTLFEDGDEMDPISDAVRATTDGHIVLSRDLAERGVYPAIDVLKSISRVMRQLTDPEHLKCVEAFRLMLADLAVVQDLSALGAYTPGSNPQYDRALEMAPRLMEFLRQDPGQPVDIHRSIQELFTLTAHQEANSQTPRPMRRTSPAPSNPYGSQS